MDKHTMDARKVTFLDTLRINVDNEKLSDTEFREFIKRNLPLYYPPESLVGKDVQWDYQQGCWYYVENGYKFYESGKGWIAAGKQEL